MKTLILLVLSVAAACADEGDSKFKNITVDNTATVSAGASIQNQRSTSSSVQQLQWCLVGGTCDPTAVGGWTLGTDGSNRMVLQAGQGGSALLDVFHVDSSGNLVIPSRITATSATFSGTLTFDNSLNLSSTTLIDSSANLKAIHSFASDTTNFQVSGDNVIFNRSTSGAAQQVQFLVGNSELVAGAYVLGPSSGNFTLLSGASGTLVDVFHVDGSGNLVIPSRITAGSATFLGALTFDNTLNLSSTTLIDSSANLKAIHSFASDTTNFQVSGDNVIFNRASSGVAQQVQFLVGSSELVAGAYVLGPSSGNFTLLSGTSGTLVDVFHVDGSGNLAVPSRINAASETLSGTLTVGGGLVVNGTVTFSALSAGGSSMSVLCQDTGTGLVYQGGCGSSTPSIFNRSAYNVVQQIGWQVGGSSLAVGAFALGSDSNGYFGLVAGNGSADNEVAYIDNAGNLTVAGGLSSSATIASTGTSGLIRASATGLGFQVGTSTVINSSRDFAGVNATFSGTFQMSAIAAGSSGMTVACVDSSGFFYSGGCAPNTPPIFNRSAYNVAQQIDWQVTGLMTVNGAYALGPDGLGNFALYSGTGGTPLDVFHVDSSGNLVVPSRINAGSETLSGTLTVQKIAAGSLTLGSSPMVTESQGAFDNVHDYSPIVGLLGANATSSLAIANHFEATGSLVREGAIVGAVMTGTGTSDIAWESDAVIGMAVQKGTGVNSVPVQNIAVAGSFFSSNEVTGGLVEGVNILVQDWDRTNTSCFGLYLNTCTFQAQALNDLELDLNIYNTGSLGTAVNYGVAYPNGHATTATVANAYNLTGGGATNYFDFIDYMHDGTGIVGLHIGRGNNGASGSACTTALGLCSGAAIGNNSMFVDLVSGSSGQYTTRVWNDAGGKLDFITNQCPNPPSCSSGNTNFIEFSPTGGIILTSTAVNSIITSGGLVGGGFSITTAGAASFLSTIVSFSSASNALQLPNGGISIALGMTAGGNISTNNLLIAGAGIQVNGGTLSDSLRNITAAQLSGSSATISGSVSSGGLTVSSGSIVCAASCTGYYINNGIGGTAQLINGVGQFTLAVSGLSAASFVSNIQTTTGSFVARGNVGVTKTCTSLPTVVGGIITGC